MPGKKLSFFSLLFIPLFSADGQQKFTLSGFVKDKATGEELIAGAVWVQDVKGIGAIANQYGFYVLSLPKGKYTIVSKLTGYKEQSQTIDLDRNIKFDWHLEEKENVMNEVQVIGVKESQNISTSNMGTEKLDIKETSKIPTLFGERDVLKIIQLLPGIKSAGEGNGNFHVRGGAADQNLVLLDEAHLYNPSHLLGFFSTFNGDVVKDVTIIKGNSPAQYGGRLSSVLDVRMREGNNQKFQTSGGLGLISSRLAIEGPIQKNKSSFLIAGRRSYADLFLKLIPKYADYVLFFNDLNLKANYQIDESNRIFVSGYIGEDQLGLSSDFGIKWGNKTGTIRWNRTFNANWFSNTSLIYSNYYSDSRIDGLGSEFNFNSQIRDWNLKQEFQYYPNNKNEWRFGFNSIHHSFMPTRFETGKSQPRESRYGWENAMFASNTFKADSLLTVEYGLRVSSYSVLGKGRFNILDKGLVQDSITLGQNQIGKTYLNLEPRISASIAFNSKTSLKAAYSRNTQSIHLLSNSTSTFPTDQWIGNSYNVKPELCDQFSLGFFRNLAENRFEFSVETYFKYLQNQVDYKNGAEIKTAPDVETELLYGIGRAYGLEFFLKKRTGRFTGWLGYTLSTTERKIEGINKGAWYLARQDRTHELSLVGMFQFTDRWSLSGNFVYYTGNAVTFPRGKYEINNAVYLFYPQRNTDRMPAYHRMDISIQYESRKTKKVESAWNFSIYNLYGRENAYAITLEQEDFGSGKFTAMQTALFRWVPGITYSFKF